MDKHLMKASNSISKFRILIRVVLCLLIISFGIIAFVHLSSIMQKPNTKLPEQLLKTLITVPVKIQNYRYEFSGYGTVKPETEIKVSAELKGDIVYEAPEFTEGNFVKKGAVLLKIDDVDYRLAVKEAETQVVSYKVKIEIAEEYIKDGKEMESTKLEAFKLKEIDYKRKQLLKEKNAISLSTVEEAMIQMSEAKHAYIKSKNDLKNNELELKSLIATLERAKVSLLQARADFEKSIIKAPIDGRLENISISINEYVSSGSPLFEINSRDIMCIDVPVEVEDALYLMDFEYTPGESNNDWFKLLKNTEAKIFWTGDLIKYEWQGSIVSVKKFDAETRTLTLEVRPIKYIGKTKNTVPLVEGMFCKIYFKGKTIKNTIKIPWASLQLNGKVFVVNEDSVAEERTPEILNTHNDEIIISSNGFFKGEHIVAQRIPQNVVNGMKVKTLTIDSVKNN